MQSLAKRGTNSTIKIRFLTESDRAKGLYEMFDSGIKASCIGNKEYIVAQEQLEIFDSKNIKYQEIQ
jgi:hypothetical protein